PCPRAVRGGRAIQCAQHAFLGISPLIQDPMKFLNFLHAEHGARLGALVSDEHVLDLTAAWPQQPAPASVDELIAAGDAALAEAKKLLEAASAGIGRKSMDNVPDYATTALLPPVASTGRNTFNVGRNYRDHIIEGNLANGRPADAF